MKDVMNRKLFLIAIVLLFTLLAACAPGGALGPQTSIEIDTVIIYEREGGFAGMSQEWVIHPDGLIDGPGDQQLVVPPEEVQELMQTGVESDIESLLPDMATPDACCDQFTYTLTFVAGDQEWSLVMTDTSEQSPGVSELFSMTEELIADAEPVP